jgi:hypothetical protein
MKLLDVVHGALATATGRGFYLISFAALFSSSGGRDDFLHTYSGLPMCDQQHNGRISPLETILREGILKRHP